MSECPRGHGELQRRVVERTKERGYFGETPEEYGATPENNRSVEVRVEILECPTCDYKEEREL